VFANIILPIGPGPNHQSHCLSRAVDESSSASVTTSLVNSCNSYDNYTDMWQCSSSGPHAAGHAGVGAVMNDIAASPSDPIFYLHHGFIDRNWLNWQNAKKDSRLYQINGNEVIGVTTLDTPLYSSGVLPDVTVRDVMDTAGGYLCYKYDY
jgi:tyrosinase